MVQQGNRIAPLFFFMRFKFFLTTIANILFPIRADINKFLKQNSILMYNIPFPDNCIWLTLQLSKKTRI